MEFNKQRHQSANRRSGYIADFEGSVVQHWLKDHISTTNSSG